MGTSVLSINGHTGKNGFHTCVPSIDGHAKKKWISKIVHPWLKVNDRAKVIIRVGKKMAFEDCIIHWPFGINYGPETYI